MVKKIKINEILLYGVLLFLLSIISIPYLTPLADHIKFEFGLKLLAAIINLFLITIFYNFYWKKKKPGWLWTYVERFEPDKQDLDLKSEIDAIYEDEIRKDLERSILQLALNNVKSADLTTRKLAIEQLCQFKGDSSLYKDAYNNLRDAYEKEIEEKSKIAIIRAICHFHCLIYGKKKFHPKEE